MADQQEQPTKGPVETLKDWFNQNRESLRAAGVSTITAAYSGAGDEGQFDDVTVEPEGAYRVPGEIQALLEDVVDSTARPGYENGDGGGGSIVLDVESGKIRHTSYDYYTERTDHEDEEI